MDDNHDDPGRSAVRSTLAALLTPVDLEREYRIDRGTQKALRARRQIPFVRLGGGRLIRYERSAITRWIASRAVPMKGEREATITPIGIARAKRAGTAARPLDVDDDDGHGPAVAS